MAVSANLETKQCHSQSMNALKLNISEPSYNAEQSISFTKADEDGKMVEIIRPKPSCDPHIGKHK